MSQGLQEATRRTREYGRKFGVEYSQSEIRERLISDKVFSLKVQKSKVKSPIVRKKIVLAKELVKEIGENFSDVLMVGVTGSVAAGYPLQNSDIDLMIVTKTNTLWLTRLRLRIWIWYKGIPHRQYGAKEKANEFCFNLWLEEDSLRLPKSRQNLKNAMDLILMKPILDKDSIYKRFVIENDWAKKYVATGYERIKSKIQSPKPKIREENIFKKGMNWLVFWPQWWYMRGKLGNGLVDLKRAFFHPNS